MKNITIPEKLYISTDIIPKTRTRKGFLKEYFKLKCPATFHDSKFESAQSKARAFRSFTDLTALVRSRFRVTSLEAVIRITAEIFEEQKAELHLVWCTRINKVVVKPKPSSVFISSYSRRNHYTKTGEDGLSLKKVYEIAQEKAGLSENLSD